jgi:hypothetical protein
MEKTLTTELIASFRLIYLHVTHKKKTWPFTGQTELTWSFLIFWTSFAHLSLHFQKPPCDLQGRAVCTREMSEKRITPGKHEQFTFKTQKATPHPQSF